jgi:CDP-diacylglycerol--serine O-phosphatidyltransferase
MNPVRRGRRPPQGRRAVRRAVVMLPNGLTLANLFCGIYAIILGTRGDFAVAPGFLVLGGIADTLDGRVARATGTGSRFGEELDSLVDVIAFGFAPAFLMYLEIPDHGTWEWLLVFIFTSCAVMRLARFNVEQAGRKKTHFHGLPSPAAGLTLASYYWFSQSPLYNQTVILFTDSKTLSDLPWQVILRGLMAILAALMISDVPYPAVPSVGFGSLRKLLGSVIIVGGAVLLATGQKQLIFPALLLYVLFGAVQWVALGFLGRSATPGEIFWEEEEPGDGDFERPAERRSATPRPRHAAAPAIGASTPSAAEPRAASSPDDAAAGARRKRRRRGRSHRPGGPASGGVGEGPPSHPNTPSDSSE